MPVTVPNATVPTATVPTATVPTMARHLLSLTVIVAVLSPYWLPVAPAVAEKPAPARRVAELIPRITAGDLQQVKVLFELEGTLALKSETDTPTKLPVQAKAHLIYSEKVLQGGTATTPWATATVRHYETAQATIKFRETTVSPQLREDRRIVGAAAVSAKDVVLYSPMGPLQRDELDLLDVPANSAIIDGLLPNRRVTVGETWKLESPLLPAVLGMDAVNGQDVRCTLDHIDGNSAVVHVQGSVSGASEGVATEITLAAKLNFDLTRSRVTWFAMSLKENRSVGHAQPGIEATVRLQMALAKRTAVPALDPGILADLNLSADDTTRLIEFTSSVGGFELLLSRNWHEMIDKKDVSVLRLVEQGDLIAQCNISALPPMEDGVPFTLIDFQQDVKNALDKNFADFVTSSEEVNDNGLHVMRVVATGKISDLSIDWMYYHITDNQGRRASCVFTCESELADRFGAIDQSVISSFRFRVQP